VFPPPRGEIITSPKATRDWDFRGWLSADGGSRHHCARRHGVGGIQGPGARRTGALALAWAFCVAGPLSHLRGSAPASHVPQHWRFSSWRSFVAFLIAG